MSVPVLSLDAVSAVFSRGGHRHTAVDEVSLELGRGEVLGVIGESGSGKSTLARLATGLRPPDAGRVRFEGAALDRLSARELRATRRRLAMVFQEPAESLNPMMSVGRIVAEPLRVHEPGLDREQRRARVHEALEHVALDPALAGRRPRALSGGQQQRVSLARAIVNRPRAVVLDEPTSALDLSVQAQVLLLLRRLQDELGLALLFISHDIECVSFMSQRVAVMYQGRVVETGPCEEVLTRPRHPYTRQLLSASLWAGGPIPAARAARRTDGGQAAWRPPRGPSELVEVARHHLVRTYAEPATPVIGEDGT